VRTDLRSADLTGCCIYGASAWDLVLKGAKQQNLVITPERQPTITVDNIEVGQLIYLMLHNQKVRDVIDTITSKVVLILGRFTAERKAVLDALREELRKRDYLPILFDFDVPATRDITETVSLLARMARFIIADQGTVLSAHLSKADLSHARLLHTYLVNANLTQAKLFETIFSEVDLTSVIGLETCIHEGPSIIDHRTLQMSGSLPIPFLRGIGLPDNFIDYIPSLFNKAIRYYSCFISYSTADDEFAKRIYADLQSNGVRCWFAPHDMPIGEKILDSIDAAIRLRDTLPIGAHFSARAAADGCRVWIKEGHLRYVQPAQPVG
jgi:uncharacterized protein YjbI with pentapeptide repeats